MFDAEGTTWVGGSMTFTRKDLKDDMMAMEQKEGSCGVRQVIPWESELQDLQSYRKNF